VIRDELDRSPFRYYKLGPDLCFVCSHDQDPADIEALVACVRGALGAGA
jgi:hypothetical protein